MKAPCLVTGSARPGIRILVWARTSQSRLSMRIASSLIQKHIPRANHRPARVAMNGWTFR